MGLYGKILSVFLCGAYLCAPAGAFTIDNCDNEAYRRANPERCVSDAESGFSFGSTVAAVGGVSALIGGAVALLGMSGGGDSDSGSSVSVAPNPTVLNRYNHPTTISYSMVGADVDNTRLASIMSDAEYIRNTNQYNDIRLAYSLARGYTGKNSTVAVFDSAPDDVVNKHGADVSYLAAGIIAPDAVVENYVVANSDGEFDSYDKIANTIATAQNANIYNFSWSVGNTANQIKNRQQLERMTSKKFVDSVTNAAVQKDAILVWAAGNDYNDESSALSAMPLVVPELNGHFVNVVAWDSDTGALADFSNACGVTKNYCITAPGTNLDSPNSKRPINGTSFAAPIVSAAIAVIREAFPYMQSNQITALLFETARDLGDVGVDAVYGHGLLDLERATRPVGVEQVPLADGMTVALRTAQVSGAIGQGIKSKDISFAFVDSYGRAFQTSLNDNISIRNRGIGIERLRENQAMRMQFGNLEFGFKSSEFLMGSGFLQTDADNTITFIGLNDSVKIGSAELFHRTTFGVTSPEASPESMVSGFSDIYTASVSVGAKYGDWQFSIGTPDTIIGGNMYLRTPTGRSANGEYIYTNHRIDLASRPSVEYSASYKSLTAGFVDNPYGTDEFYVLTRGRVQF